MKRMDLLPAEILHFRQHHDMSLVIIPDDFFEYSHRWITWWRAIQPKWRIIDESGGVISANKKKQNWGGLSSCGWDGMILPLVGLAIWSLSLRGRRVSRASEGVLKIWIDDVTSVLHLMTVSK